MHTKSNPLKVLYLVMVLAVLLSACGGGQTATEGTTAPEEPVVVATEAPKIEGKLTVWCWKAAWTDAIVKSGALDAFLAENPGVTIDYVEYAPADLYQKLPLALQAGTGAPDVACVESSHLAQFVALGGLTDLTDRVTPYLDKINTYKWADAMADGKYYAMPWDSGPVVFYYRRDVFEAAGLASDPESVSALVATWEDYLNVCKTIKEKTGSECFSNNKANNYGRLYEMMLWQQGLGYYDADGKVTVDSPENIATLEMMAKFWDEGLTSDQLEWTDGWYAELALKTPAEKPIATLVEAAWMGVFLKSWIAVGTEGKWGVAEMPTMAAGQVRAANDGGSNLVIPDQSQNKDTAWALTEWLLGRDDSQVAIFKAADFLPSLETTYNDPVFSEPDPFFADQIMRQTYIKVGKIIPTAYVYGPHYSEMNGLVATAIQKVGAGQMTAAEALKEAADAIRAQLGMP
jgi:lactose/L-arabinose transport system substrate-binding protein